ncbi:MAG: hypothetical protein V4684_11825 [Pseudomonadota bacterium]
MHTLPASDLALQHILRSGLAVVNDEPIDQARRTDVLHALVEIFSDAQRGSQALAAQNFLMSANESPAFERFALFFRYLNRTCGNDLPQRIAEATQVLSAIEEEHELAPDAKSRVADLFQHLLSAIARESALSPLVSPRELRLSF